MDTAISATERKLAKREEIRAKKVRPPILTGTLNICVYISLSLSSFALSPLYEDHAKETDSRHGITGVTRTATKNPSKVLCN